MARKGITGTVRVYKSRSGANGYCKKLRTMYPQHGFDVHSYEFGWAVFCILLDGSGRVFPCA